MHNKTDTERLHWMIGKQPEFDHHVSEGKIVQFWVRWFEGSYWRIAYGDSESECIDNALAGKYEEIR